MSDINKMVLESINDDIKNLDTINERGAGMLAAGAIGGMAYMGSKMAKGIQKGTQLAAAAHKKKLELAGGG